MSYKVSRAMMFVVPVLLSFLSVTKEHINLDHGFDPCPKCHYCSMDDGTIIDDLYNF
jgi:hypothetical protein